MSKGSTQTNWRGHALTVVSKVLHHPLFWLGLAIRVGLAIGFPAEKIDSLFLPFLNTAIDIGWKGAYATFANLGSIEAFPYPLVMYGVLYFPLKLISLFGIEQAQVFSAMIRITLICFDFAILIILSSWLRRFSIRNVLGLYWLSPLLIYISYIHGQLDVIPIALLMMAFYYLFRDKFDLAGLFLGIAICAKTHTIIAAPLFLVYLLKNRISLVESARFLIGFAVITTGLMAWGIQSEGLVSMVFQNSTQQRIFLPHIVFENTASFLILPAIYLVTLLGSLRFVRINRDLLIFLIAFVFTSITVCLVPMPGWYFWFMPFMIYFVLKETHSLSSPGILILGSTQLLALLYWEFNHLVFLPGIGPLLNTSPYAKDLIFTGLQTSVLVQLFILFRSGFIGKKKTFTGYTKPFLITISGDSGAGKTTLTQGLLSILGQKNTLVLSGDGMHKWERGHHNWNARTHLDPKANDLHNDYFNLRSLKRGESIYRRDYDHTTGQFTDAKHLLPKPIIISEGLHASYLQSMRSLSDLKLFLRPNQTLAEQWKIDRDMAKRGHSKETVLSQIAHRQPDKEKYITVQEKHADIIFELIPNPDNNQELGLRIKCVNTIYAEYLCEFWESVLQLKVSHHYIDDEHQEILIFGQISSETLYQESIPLFPHLADILYPYQEVWPNGMTGMMCHFIIFTIFYDDFLRR